MVPQSFTILHNARGDTHDSESDVVAVVVAVAVAVVADVVVVAAAAAVVVVVVVVVAQNIVCHHWQHEPERTFVRTAIHSYS